MAEPLEGPTGVSSAQAEEGSEGLEYFPKNIIHMISDGMGYNHVDIVNLFETGDAANQVSVDPSTGAITHHPGEGSQVYESWDVQVAMSTHQYGNTYDPNDMWASFGAVMQSTTDSAASGTALATGTKTHNDVLGLGPDGEVLENVAERAQSHGWATGVVSSVPFSHATPASWGSHVEHRGQLHEIARQMIASDLDVIVAPGHPLFNNAGQPRTPNYQYIGQPEFEALQNDETPFTFTDDYDEILALAEGDTPERVFAVPKVATTLQYERPRGSATMPFEAPFNADIPTLAELSRAALNALSNASDQGLFVMIEGGAVDWAGHANHTIGTVEEQTDFNHAVEAVVEWVETESSWDETLVVVTADHETGHLQGPGANPTWTPMQSAAGQLPGVTWHSGWHTNALVPFYAHGQGAEAYLARATGNDPVRGAYLDNTDLALVAFDLLEPQPSCLTLGSDEFEADELADTWTVLREDPDLYSVGGGVLDVRFTGTNIDMSGSNANSPNVLLQPAPSQGPWSVTTLMDVSEARAHSNQAGLMVWQQEAPNHFTKVTYNARVSGVPSPSWWVERQQTVAGSTSGVGNGNTGTLGEQPDALYLRLESDGGDVETITSSYSLDGEQWLPVQEPFEVDTAVGPLQIGLGLHRGENNPDGGVGFEYFRVCDHALDQAPPHTSHVLDPQVDGEAGWHVSSPVEVSLHADDGDEGTGVALTEYRIDGDDWATYDDPFVVSAEAATLIEYRSVDVAGNVEPIRQVEVKIDLTAPQSTATLDPADPGAGEVYDEPVTVTLQATDETSGVERIEFRHAGAQDWQEYVTPIWVREDGEYEIEFRAVDVAGNVEEIQSVSFETDGLPPMVSCLAMSTDEFEGDVLDPKWTILRENPSLYSVSDGRLDLRFDGTNSDMAGGTATATNVLLQPAPTTEPWSVTTQMDVTDARAASNQGGLMLWQGEQPNHFAKVTFNARGSGSDQSWWVERYQTLGGSPSGTGNGNTGLLGEVPDTVFLRLESSGGVVQTFEAFYSLDGEQWLPVQGPFEMDSAAGPIQVGLALHRGENNPSGGIGFEYFRVCDHALDLAAPTTSHTLAPDIDGDEGWHVSSPVEVSLHADDGEGGSGVEVTEYRIDGGDWATYDDPFVISTEGVTSVEYRSTDVAGNVEAIVEVEARIDTVAPQTTATLDPAEPGGDGAYDQPVTLTLDADDATSGVAETHWRVAGAEDHEVYDAPVVFDEPGTYELEYRSVDVAGNVEDWQEVSFEVVDDGPPPVELELELVASTRCVTGNVFVTLTARSDNEVPVDVELESEFGSRVFVGVAPGRFASHAFNTRAGSLGDGSVTVRASAIIDGDEATGEWSVDYTGLSC